MAQGPQGWLRFPKIAGTVRFPEASSLGTFESTYMAHGNLSLGNEGARAPTLLVEIDAIVFFSLEGHPLLYYDDKISSTQRAGRTKHGPTIRSHAC